MSQSDPAADPQAAAAGGTTAPPTTTTLQQLERRERRLDIAEALAGFGTWDWDLATGTGTWSDQLFVIYGWPKDAGVPAFDAWQETIHPEDRHALGACIAGALARESRYRIEFRIFARGSGDMRYILSQGISRVDVHGRVVGMGGVDQDITEARLAHLALQRSEQRLRTLTTLSSDWLWEQDEHFRFTRTDTPQATGPYAVPSPHAGMTCWELPHVDMDADTWARHRAQLERREVYRDFESRVLRPDGSVQHYLSSGEPRFDADGRFLGYRGVSRDVTQEREAASALATTARRFQQVLSNLYGGILLVNGAGVVEYVNQGFCSMFTLPHDPQDLLGLQSHEVMNLIDRSHSDGPANRERVRAMVEAGEAVFGEEIRMSGNKVYLRDFIPITIDGASHGRLWVHRDISTSKLIEDQLQASLREKEALLKEVHHRVKNNLQVITSLLRLESRRSTQGATQVVLDEMQGRIRTMAVLHESLYQSGTFASVDLGVYLAQLAQQVFRAHGGDGRQIALHLDLASVPVGMDQATPCGLVLNELVSNSLKHGFPPSHSGEVHVRLWPLEGTAAVCLQVRDTGVGLPADFASRCRASLGLQLVADLALQADGSLDIGAGPGACFSVVFTPQGPPPPGAAGPAVSGP